MDADRMSAIVPAKLNAPAGRTRNLGLRFTVPTHLAARSCTLIASVNSAGRLVERDESNNTVAGVERSA